MKSISGKERASLSIDLDEAKSSGLNKIVSFESDIRLEGITYRYPETENVVLDDINLCIKKGMSVGVVGASGAGKTTAIDLLLGLLTPEKGRVLLDEVNIQDDIIGFLNMVGYIPQSIFMMDDQLSVCIQLF